MDDTYKTERDEWGNLVYYENANGWWWSKQFDENGNLLYWADASGFWVKKTYDKNNNQISYENYLGIKRSA